MDEEQNLILSHQQACRCNCCFENVQITDHFCQACGYPLKGSAEQQKIFTYRRGFKEMELKILQKKIKSGSITMYVLAAYFFLVGLVLFFINRNQNVSSAVLVTNAAIAIVFLLLGYWSVKKPVAAILSGMVLFIIVQLIPLIENPASLFQGIFIKIIIMGYLIKGLQSAFDAEKIIRQHNL